MILELSKPRAHRRFARAHCSFLVASFVLLFLELQLRADSLAPLTVPRFVHPGAGQVFYFVLTDRFSNGSTSNDEGGLAGGRRVSGFDPTDFRAYHGGDLAGLTAKLDYIKGLGVTAIWITPPFTNKAVQGEGTGYHGYWILDFTRIDPHLGTEQEFSAFVSKAHALGLKVYLDIVINHTADVITSANGSQAYKSMRDVPYVDASGKPFDLHAVTYNGVNSPDLFPALSATRSFPCPPVVAASEAHSKAPDWLNDVTLYHNRGNSTFKGEDSLFGDFGGLDDVFTENPRVVRGFIDVYAHWIEQYKIDGFRIDTVRHVNTEFWQAFSPAIQERARAAGKPGFLMFGEVAIFDRDLSLLSHFTTTGGLDATLDFGFYTGVRDFLSQGHAASRLDALFTDDSWYIHARGNAQTQTTFISNHDNGRFPMFVRQDNPGVTDALTEKLTLLADSLLMTARGQPVLYYGDEQGMVGIGDNDGAREDMFASRARQFKNLTLIGTSRTGADDKFDTSHPFYRALATLSALRTGSPALSTGAMLVHPTGNPHVFSFSRIDSAEQVEYLVALSNDRTQSQRLSLATLQPGNAILQLVYDSQSPLAPTTESIMTDAGGRASVELSALQCKVWRASARLPIPNKTLVLRWAWPASGQVLTFTRHTSDAQVIPDRQELRAEVASGDGLVEVTYAMARASRPGQFELLGVADAPPYSIHWRPPADLSPNDTLTFIATADDLRGHVSSESLTGITVAPTTIEFGIRGATVPLITEEPGPDLELGAGRPLVLSVRATGTPPFLYSWLHNGHELPGANQPTLRIEEATARDAGDYRVVVRNREGTTLGAGTHVKVADTGSLKGTLVVHPLFPSAYITPREVDVWLPPGYDSAAERRYPVIYMHDGQNLFLTSRGFGGGSWHVDRAIEHLVSQGKTQGAIVVAIWNHGAARAEEFMPKKAVTATLIKDVSWVFTPLPDPLRSDDYLKFLVRELKPMIDSTYRTRPDRDHTLVMGSSMGGLISAYALCEYPDVFGRAGCLSTHWPAGDGAVIAYLDSHLPDPRTHRLYFDHGTATLDAFYAPYQDRVDALMRAHGFQEGKSWESAVYPGAEHSEKSWSERVEVPLEFLLSP